MLTVVLSVSFVALIFVDPISGFMGQGTSLMLLTAAIVAIAISIFSSFAGSLAMPQDRVAPIIALMAGLIVQRMKGHATPESMGMTVLAAIALCSILVGLVFYWLGVQRLGNIVRFIPYPVVGGFLAGSGWLLMIGSYRIMTGEMFSFLKLNHVFDQGLLVEWLPCVVFGSATYFAVRLTRHYLALPIMVLLAGASFAVWMLLTHDTWDHARAQGWILGAPTHGGFSGIRILPALTQVDWITVLMQYGSFGAILLTSIVSLLLNISALELAADEEINLNRELRAAGLANIVSGFAGGMVGFHSLGLSMLPIRMNVRSRLVGLFSGAACLLLLWFGTDLLGYIPRFILGGILFYNGAAFLAEWVFDSYFRLHREDYFLILLILAIVALVGYLQGVGAGVLIATVLFVVKYSSVNVVSHSLSGDGHQSLVDRSPAQARVLSARGAETFILRLKGFIFFGSANNLLESVRDRHAATDRPRLNYLVLDFHHVSGLDTSGLVSLSKLSRFARREGFVILAASVSEQLEKSFQSANLLGQASGQMRLFPDRDHALEWCEDQLLNRELSELSEPVRSLPEILQQAHPWRVDTSHLMNYIDQLDIERGTTLFHQGDPANALYFIESGRVKVSVTLDNGRTMRIRTMGPGTVVGEIGLYLGQNRVASVVTEEPCRIYRCRLEDLRRMEYEAPPLASAFHEFMVRILAERLTQQNLALRALMD
jgi:SulP family sulfate permease